MIPTSGLMLESQVCQDFLIRIKTPESGGRLWVTDVFMVSGFDLLHIGEVRIHIDELKTNYEVITEPELFTS